MRPLLIAAALVGVLLSGAPGHSANEKSGLSWLRKCTNPEPNWQIECSIYVRALVEYDEARASSLGQKRHICPGADTSTRQSREAVVDFLRKHPAELHLPFAELAHRALAGAFPCGAQRP
jgi:hypothetical protein